MVVAIALAAFYGFVLLRTYPAEEAYLSEIRARDSLEIREESREYIITPDLINPEHPALIFYPGGLVDPQAYLYKLGHLAECLQAPVYIIKAPFNAAIFDVNAAGRIIDNHNLDRAWVGGHSLGGISAARFTARRMDAVEGLFLLGSYSDQDISSFRGDVVSIMGTEDLIINRENYQAAKENLPPQAEIIEVEGLNHSGFGNYGLQSGDGTSRLTDAEVIEIWCDSMF